MPATASAPATVDTESPLRKCIFLLLALWASAIFWISHHPPMIDLPQHAGQVALLLDMVKGESPWADLVRLNLGTPYLIGYGLALPLSLFMPITSALKVLLSVSCLAFAYMGVALRRHFGGDPRLDWLFLLAFFGFAGYWGFMPFLVSTPLVLLFVYLSDLHAQRPRLTTASGIFCLGLVIMVSHGLSFAFAWVVGAALIVAYERRPGRIMATAVPFLLLCIPFMLYAVASQRMKMELGSTVPTAPIYWDYSFKRLVRIVAFSVGGTTEAWVAVAALALFAAPWAMGMRIALHKPARYMPFLVTLLVALVVPERAIQSAGLYSRFLMFLLPTYALIFFQPAPAHINASRARWGEVLLVGVCCCVLGIHTWRNYRFDREEADFRSAMDAMQPGQRVLSLMFGRDSPAIHHRATYLHQALWYQAEKHGFVDFNFAWFPPQLMRFRPGHVPPAIAGFEWDPGRFSWDKDGGELYRYFVVREGPDMPADIFAGAPCKPVRLKVSGSWTVFERKPCR